MGEPAAQSQKTKESSVNEHAQNMEFQVRAEQQTVAPEEVNKVARKNCSVTGEVPESIFMNSIITWIIFTDLWCHRPDICAIMM